MLLLSYPRIRLLPGVQRSLIGGASYLVACQAPGSQKGLLCLFFTDIQRTDRPVCFLCFRDARYLKGRCTYAC